ncbi:hypothetical protein LCGC14_0693890, partial [marine sediment metagenome]
MIGYRLVRYVQTDANFNGEKWFADPAQDDCVTSVFKFGNHWKPGLNVASCISPYAGVLFGIPPRKHAVPDEDCSCGFYAWTDLLSAVNEHIRRQRARQHLVVIKVAASGKVIEHEYGWRTAEITPLAVAWVDDSVPAKSAHRVAEILEVPLERIDVEYELDSVEEWPCSGNITVDRRHQEIVKITTDARKVTLTFDGIDLS